VCSKCSSFVAELLPIASIPDAFLEIDFFLEEPLLPLLSMVIKFLSGVLLPFLVVFLDLSLVGDFSFLGDDDLFLGLFFPLGLEDFTFFFLLTSFKSLLLKFTLPFPYSSALSKSGLRT